MPDRRSQTLERELLEFAPDAVIGVDEQGEIQLVNSLTEAVFGYSRGELIGRSVEMLVPSGLSDDHVIHRDRYFESPRTRPMGAGLDLYARRKDGTEFPCEISLSTVATDSGMMALAGIRDITDSPPRPRRPAQGGEKAAGGDRGRDRRRRRDRP